MEILIYVLHAVLIGAVVFLCINLYAGRLLLKAVFDAYDAISFEEQLEETVVIKILTSTSVHIRNFLESKIIRFLTPSRTQASKDLNNTLWEETVIQVLLLQVLAKMGLIKIRTMMVSQIELKSYWYLCKDLPEEKRKPYETFLETGMHGHSHGFQMIILNLYFYKKHVYEHAELQDLNAQIEESQFLSTHMPMLLIKKAPTGKPTKPKEKVRSAWDDSLVPA